MTTLAPARATGRALGSLRAALLVVESNWVWFRRNWTATLFSALGQPVLYLLAMGLGFGSQVRPGASTGGLSYLDYIAPALLAASAVQGASADCTYPVLSGFKWKKNYLTTTATPITPAQLMTGELTWVTLRLTVAAGIYLLVATVLGAVHTPMILVALLFGVLTGLAWGACVMAFAASVPGDGAAFNPFFRFVVVPLSLFSGTFFPITQLPAWVRPLAWITPLWHGTQLTRGITLGTLGLGPAVGHLAYLVGLLVLGVLLSRWRFRARLVA
jgi:lipooligosaccharide transport system permease protein